MTAQELSSISFSMGRTNMKHTSKHRGAVVLCLRAFDTAKARIIAIHNSQLDIERVEPEMDLADCAVVKAAEAVGDAGQ